nr:MAG TPA: hypothetical protein [Caudoviricetes sp.]
MDILARIKLAPGRVGFYDPLSRIHLTLGRPHANVISGTNCANLRRNVKTGVLLLLDGTLGGDIPPFKIVQDKKGTRIVSNGDEVNKPIVGRIEPPTEYQTPEPPGGHIELDPREKNGFGNEDDRFKMGDLDYRSSHGPAEVNSETLESVEEESEDTEDNSSEESPKKKKAAKKK